MKIKWLWSDIKHSVKQIFCRHKNLEYCGQIFDNKHRQIGWYGRCRNCGKQIFLAPGIWPIFLEQIISMTLQDLPKIGVDWAKGQDYSVVHRLFWKDKK
jgi:hypothetical protein